MSAVASYNYPDSATLRSNIKRNPHGTICGFSRKDPYFRGLKKLAIEHLSNTEKTEEELSELAQLFFEKQKGQKFPIGAPFTGPISAGRLDPDFHVEFSRRIKNVLIEFAIIYPQEINRIERHKLNYPCDPSKSDLYIAAEYGFTEEAMQIIAAHPELIQKTTEKGTSPLHIAVWKGNLEVVRLLLKAGADLQAEDNKKLMPLDFAVRVVLPSIETHCLIVKTLLEEGEKLGLKIGDISRSHLLYEGSCFEVLSLLFKHGVEIEIQGADSLKEAAKHGRTDVVGLMIANGIPVDPTKKGELSALHTAVFHRQLPVCFKLLDLKANVNLQDDTGLSPLHVAALEGYMDLVNVLLASGADVNIRDLNGYAPIHYAQSRKHQEIVSELKRIGAQTDVRKPQPSS